MESYSFFVFCASLEVNSTTENLRFFEQVSKFSTLPANSTARPWKFGFHPKKEAGSISNPSIFSWINFGGRWRHKKFHESDDKNLPLEHRKYRNAIGPPQNGALGTWIDMLPRTKQCHVVILLRWWRWHDGCISGNKGVKNWSHEPTRVFL